MSSPNSTAVAILIGALLIALGIFFGLRGAEPRYQIVATGSGVTSRVDTQTGDMTVCAFNRCDAAGMSQLPAGASVDRAPAKP